MSALRVPGWLVYPALLAVLLLAALGRRGRDDAPPSPPPLPRAESAVLAEAAPFNPALIVKVRARPDPVAGAAFSVADGGVWLTARSVIAGCARPAIMVSDTEGVAATVAASNAEAAVLTTPGGTPALPLAPDAPRAGALAFDAGFPNDRPGELATRLIGRQTLNPHGRRTPPTSVLVWGESGRTAGMTGALSGLAGAPVLDGEGRVVGVALGEASRRGRVYAAPPAAIDQVLAAAKAVPAPQAAGLAITTANYGLAADQLRRAFRIAPVVCMGR